MTGDATLTVLREIRDEVRATNVRLDRSEQRLGHIEAALLDVAEQQRSMVRWLRSGTGL